jgi:hypothetical protein
VVVCPGCGARNEAEARVCDWCGRPFVDEQRQITGPWLLPATFGAIILLAVGVIIAALLGARAASPRPPDVAASTVAAIASPTEAVIALSSDDEVTVPSEQEQTASQEFARINNTGGAGAFIRRDPQPNAPGLIALRDGSVVKVVGPDTTITGRVWRNVEDQRGNRGWTPAEYLAASPTGF